MDETFASLSFRLFHRFLFSSPSSSPRLTVSYISLSPFFSHMQDSLLALLIVDVLFLFVYPTPCPSSSLSLSFSLSFLLPLSYLSPSRGVDQSKKTVRMAYLVQSRATRPSSCEVLNLLCIYRSSLCLLLRRVNVWPRATHLFPWSREVSLIEEK